MLKMFFYPILAFFISFISMPIIIAICKKKDLYDYQDERKIHSGNIPRLGGVGIFIAFIVSVILFEFRIENITVTNALPLLIASLIIFTFGILDDIFCMKAIFKLLVQILAVLIVVISGSRITQIFGWVLPLPISWILTFGWVIGVLNAYNLIDGLDGLCGSLAMTSILSMGILYALSNKSEAGICFILAASVLGFLCWNWPPAKLFMGDAGSQFLGFAVAVIPLYNYSEDIEFNKFFMMIILAAFPIFDTIAAIWRRLREHRSIMSPDRSHLHHKLLNLGFSGPRALYMIFSFQLMLCATVIGSYFMGKYHGLILLGFSLAFMITFFSVIHYTNRAILAKQKAEEFEGK